MCGIAGIVKFDNNSVCSDEIKLMADALYHRGPDDSGIFIDNNFGMGFRRLSIIDINNGHQPMTCMDNNYTITFNGEIYNYKELRSNLVERGYRFSSNSDTEVLLNSYKEYGADCVNILRGMFSFTIYNKKDRSIFGARDRFGIKPLFYYCDNEKFVWASEIKSIMVSSKIDTTISHSAIDTYFTYGYTDSKNSIYKSIKKIPPGHYFTIDTTVVCEPIIKKYWGVKFHSDYSKSRDEWKAIIMDTFTESVKIRLMSEVPLGAFLSGGIDSSAVVAVMSKLCNEPIKTFSIGFPEAEFNELSYAKLLSKKYNTDHHEMIVNPESVSLLPKLVEMFGEPFSDSSALPTYYVSKFAKEFVTVVLSGDGGDELFAGYNDYQKLNKMMDMPINNRVSRGLFRTLNRALPDYMFGKGLSYLLSKDKKYLPIYYSILKDYERMEMYNPDFFSSLNSITAETMRKEEYRIEDNDSLQSIQKYWMNTYLEGDILTKVDRASMNNSLEVRVPILDHKLAEMSFNIPSKFKISGGTGKYIFKEAMKPLLPSEILTHRKQGFAVPLSVWFKDDLKSYINDKFLNRNSKLYDYVNYQYVQDVIKNQYKGQRDYNSKLWSLLFFNEWLDRK
jgi:asparagine synthase (glutamine-hydrolysing)